MKALLTTISLVFLYCSGTGQTMQASIGAGSAGTRVIIYIKPSAPLTNAVISTLQFSVAIDASITPVPAVSIVGTPAFGVTWNIDPPYVESGYRIYDFTTAASPSITINPAVETSVMELEFSGGPATANDVVLLTLPGGGTTTGNTLFLCTGAASSVEGQLYYARAGTTVVNNNSYTGGLSSYATLSGVLLPVTWLSFDAVKQGNDALLNWSVGNELSNRHYELQRSINGSNFTTIGTVNNSGRSNYNYTDAGITSLGAPVLYYRIKQVDINGRISFSDTRVLKLDTKGADIYIFPNPVKEGFNVTMPGAAVATAKKIKLSLVAADGKIVETREISSLQASNYYFDVRNKHLASGQYNLQIVLDDKVLGNKKIFINQ